MESTTRIRDEDAIISSIDHVKVDARKEFRMSRVKTTFPENIVFLIDTNEEMSIAWNPNFETRMAAVKDAIIKFIRRKKNSPLKHQFAVATYNSAEEVKVMLGFTNNEEQISNMVESVRPEMPDSNFAGDSDREKNNDDEESGNINLGAVLFSLSNLLKLPIPSEFRSTQNSLAENSEDCEGITMKFPNDITSNSVRISSSGCIVRCILIYGRSKEVPTDGNKDPSSSNSPKKSADTPYYIPFLHHPDYYLDILYLHLRSDDVNVKCQEIFNILSHIVKDYYPHPNGNNVQISNFNPYILESHASAIKLASHMAALLGHPVQREEASVTNKKMEMKLSVANNLRQLIMEEGKKQ